MTCSSSLLDHHLDWKVALDISFCFLLSMLVNWSLVTQFYIWSHPRIHEHTDIEAICLSHLFKTKYITFSPNSSLYSVIKKRVSKRNQTIWWWPWINLLLVKSLPDRTSFVWRNYLHRFRWLCSLSIWSIYIPFTTYGWGSWCWLECLRECW